MRTFLLKTTTFFEKTLDLRGRLLVLVGSLLLVPAFVFPLWNLTLTSNQFPEGLSLNIHADRLEGKKTANRDDLKEINALNHYIGMRPLKEEDFGEFKWIPFVLGGMVLLGLRAAVMGKMEKLVDLMVLFTYFGLFSLWSFYDKMYLYGHNLDPTAAVTVPPFMPPLFGHMTMANFEVYSYPGVGSICMALAGAVLLAAIWNSRKNPPTEATG